MDQGRINLDWCASLLQGLVSAGLEQVVISPGSRNTPLTLATLLLPQLHHQVAVDERSAAFFALGMAVETGDPVALVCTSGTAVANWLPAVVEANSRQLPLILLSADRPWELQQCQANQTIDQVRLFGEQVRAFHQLSPPEASETALRRLQALGRELVREASRPCGGPVHVNLPLREPLVPEQIPPTLPTVPVAPCLPPRLSLQEGELQTLIESLDGRKGIIVCGLDAHSGALPALGAALGVPVLADPLSSLRYGSEASVIGQYDLFLRSVSRRAQLAVEWVLHFGATPVSATLQNFLDEQTAARHWWVDASGRTMDRQSMTVETLQASTASLCGQLLSAGLDPLAPAWLEAWQEADRQVALQLQKQPLPLEASILRHALEALPDRSLLFSGNSLAVRFLDAYSGKLDKSITVHGNRGASGIDGNLSTMAGIARACMGGAKVLGILGDLAFFHDLNALALARDQDMILLLFNNQGGGIFDFLPQQALPEYEACWRTPVPLDHGHIASAFGVDHFQVTDVQAFDEAFAAALRGQGLQLIEIVIDSAQTRELHEAVIAHWLN
ncbi:2-succinyl-5-enolpyruvyl-6-hydroxy-3-cyclohexene-1-carboxylic-acid synthase [Thiolapillus sp.]|uniref:2-succinyl-5-enolpyruvyl-6-hydroxy-3- cyclohexene-1-carboxylic-acid synthase n=1 Tax=Thiolapillus sp. TaxID=2017437 RepID=UPI0025FCF6D2|nr:2-succinyl-5-enolpyruvyl-6-hydroxy-3-cyclohexene-1-carboxylic-acid synthase [Thiolapillus sp.]